MLEMYKYSKEVEVIKDYSYNFLKSMNDDSLDFVYIDADHSYDAVKSDLLLSHDKVKSGGIIAGHDYDTLHFPGVVRAVDEFIAKHDLEMISTTDDLLSSYFINNRKCLESTKKRL